MSFLEDSLGLAVGGVVVTHAVDQMSPSRRSSATRKSTKRYAPARRSTKARTQRAPASPKTFVYRGHRYQVKKTVATQGEAKSKAESYFRIGRSVAIQHLSNGRWAIGVRSTK